MEFENQATLSFNNKLLKSNTVKGELVSPFTINKYSTHKTYQQNSEIEYSVFITNNLDTDMWVRFIDDMGANGESQSPMTFKMSIFPKLILPMIAVAVKPEGISTIAMGGPTVGKNYLDHRFLLPAKTPAIVLYTLNVNTFADLTQGASITNKITLYSSPTMLGNYTFEDESSYTIDVKDYSDIRISKYLYEKQAAIGQPLSYVLMASNYGNTASSPEITDVIEPYLTNIRVYVNGSELTKGTQYTYDNNSLLTIPQDTLTIPPATFTKNEVSGEWTITPSALEITITGIAANNP